MGRKPSEYAVYRGDEFVCLGTYKECAAHLGISPETVRFYGSPAHLKRSENNKFEKDFIVVIRIEEDEDE